jgi:hypothetical protein
MSEVSPPRGSLKAASLDCGTIVEIRGGQLDGFCGTIVAWKGSARVRVRLRAGIYVDISPRFLRPQIRSRSA